MGSELFSQMLKCTKSGKFNVLFDRYWDSGSSHYGGLESVKGEFNLVAMAWNLKRMFVLTGKFGTEMM